MAVAGGADVVADLTAISGQEPTGLILVSQSVGDGTARLADSLLMNM